MNDHSSELRWRYLTPIHTELRTVAHVILSNYKIVSATIFLCGLIASLYVFSVKPRYVSEVIIAPPPSEYLQAYNNYLQTLQETKNLIKSDETFLFEPIPTIKPLTATQLFNTFTSYAKSPHLAKSKIIPGGDILGLVQMPQDKTKKSELPKLLIETLPTPNQDNIKILAHSQNPTNTLNALKNRINLASIATNEVLKEQLITYEQQIKSQLKRKISLLQRLSTIEHKQHIKHLEDAISIASATGISKPAVENFLFMADSNSPSSNRSYNNLLFLQGTVALRAKLKAIKKHHRDGNSLLENDIHLQLATDLLENLPTTIDDIKPYTIISLNEKAETLTRTNKLSIIFISSLLGLILSTMILLSAHIFRET